MPSADQKFRQNTGFENIAAKSVISASLFFAAAGAALSIFAYYPSLFFRYQKTCTESVVAMAVFNLPVAPFIYKPFGDPPIIFPYNPIYVYLSYVVSVFTGNSFVCGRLVSWAAFFGSVFFLYRILRLENSPRAVAAISTSEFEVLCIAMS